MRRSPLCTPIAPSSTARSTRTAPTTTVHFEYVDDADFQQSGWANATATLSTIGDRDEQALPERQPARSTGSQPAPSTTTASSATNEARQRQRCERPSRPSPSRRRSTTPAPTPTSASRPAPRCCSTAAPTSWSRPPTPAAMTSSRTWSPGRRRSAATRRPRTLAGPLRGPRRRHPGHRQPDQPRRRPLRRDPRRRRLEHRIRRHPGRRPLRHGPFASTLAEADPSLDTFAFGGPDICSPCFADGSTGDPVHLPDGRLVQGMVGLDRPRPRGNRRASSAGTSPPTAPTSSSAPTSQFEPDGNNNGDVSIYDRNLNSGRTHVVSKTPAGATMTGAGIGELDISSRRLADRRRPARLTEAAGNRLLAPLHERRRLRPHDRPHARHDRGRPL